MTLPTLINTQSTFEVVRDRIAQILKDESVNQMALATTALLDPAQWDLSIFTERTNPWEQQLNTPGSIVPIVNVWYDRSAFSKSKSNSITRRQSQIQYNIDIIGYGQSSNDGSGGHVAGDESAAREAHRGARLVSKILMSPEHINLGMLGVVGDRWISDMSSFQPDQGTSSVQKQIAVRITLEVDCNEFSVGSDEGTLLSEVGATIQRASDGSVLATADFIY